ncbi:hypothetical protein ACHAW5_007670 [Stephanodiscus triporus]|uniref:beta-ketoacyl-[acyl-carrier-protein] synthase I n=1 Tax=Stephanodiscus triporus TaxID=2934178 RepID=A0ABD3PMC6_9STRA
MKAMTTSYNDDLKKKSHRFDANQGRLIMGVGVGVIVLESLDSVLARGAKIYCKMVGYGGMWDAHHINTPAPVGQGLTTAMEMAIAQSSIADQLPYKDKFKTMAFKSVFREHATKKDGKFVVSSTKCVTGHMPGINYVTPDPDCDLYYVPNTKREMEVHAAMSMNLGFGGHNAVILFKKYSK